VNDINATVRPPTEDELRAWRAELDAQMKTFQQAYETSTGIERHRNLLAALAVCDSIQPDAKPASSDRSVSAPLPAQTEPEMADPTYLVPSWLYKALCEQEAAVLRQVEPDMHWIRWMMVWEGKRQKRQVMVRGKLQEKEWTWPQARKYASEKLADTRWAGGVDAVKYSYDHIQHVRRRLG
jgi:hypothetical protein